MKKSLSLLLAIALVFSMFSGLAFAEEKTATDKVVDWGLIKGDMDGDLMEDQKWDREDVVVILSRLLGVEAEAKATAKTHTYADVTDPFYDGYLSWAKTEGLFQGNSNVDFGYNESITTHQFVAVMLRALGYETQDENYEGAKQLAIDLGLVAADTDFTIEATRGTFFGIIATTVDTNVKDSNVKLGAQLGLSGYEQAEVAASITGVREVTVNFGTAVDTNAAKLALKKGNVAVATTTEWSEDNKTATLNLTDVRISEGTYTVTITGADVSNDTLQLTAENEKVVSIEFATATDEIAFTTKAKVNLRAENQYGELASFPASSYTVFTGYGGSLSERVTKNDDGVLVVELNTNAKTGTPPNDSYVLTQGVSQIPVTVYFNDTRLTASKTFKVGTAPFVTKIELGEVEYDGNKTSLSAAGDVATIPVKLFDQYGNPITEDQGVNPSFNEVIQPYSAELDAETDDYDNDTYFETKVTLDSKVAKSATYNVTVYAGGSSATTTFNVGAGKVATTVAFGDFNDVLAAGDGKKYIPVIAYDSEGNQLTKDEMVDSTNYDRIRVSVSGPITGTIPTRLVQSGPNKGSVLIDGIAADAEKQTVFVTANISEIDANDFKSTSIIVQDARIPETLVVNEKAATKAVLGAESEFEIVIKDQYGKELKNLATGYTVDVSVANLDGTSPQITVQGQTDNNHANLPVAAAQTITYAGNQAEQFNKGFEFVTTAGVYGKAQVKAELKHNTTVLRTVSQTIESINPANVTLNYALKNSGDLYAALDSKLLATTEDASDSQLAKKVVIEVKDSAGNLVAFPEDKVQTVTVSNGIAVTYAEGDGTANDANKFYLLGNKAGTSTVTATVYSAKGEIVAASGTVTVKADPVTVASIKAENDDIDYTTIAAVAGEREAYALMDLEVVDNYGIKYETTDINKYSRVIGITYTITGVKNGTVSIDANNQITIGAGVTEFTLTAHAPNGQTATTLVYTTTP